MANTFKKVIDRQMWVQVHPSATPHGPGMGFASDLRNDVSRNPFVYQLSSATVLNRFNIITKSWQALTSPALGGTFGAGAAAVFAPSLGLMGAIGAGCTTTSIVTTTTINAIAPNMLANRGGSGDYGYRVRIIGKAAGKVEERWIVGNTGGTTPTLTLNLPLSFTPASGDEYEVLGGRLFMLSAGSMATGAPFKAFEVAANGIVTHSITNLPATVSADTTMVALDEQYVPYDAQPGEGFITGDTTYDTGGLFVKNCLVATASGASSITGQATGGDATVLANEYRNFQIRIVEDSVNPGSVGQRRVIASHTGPGASPVYTLGTAWTTQPSSSAKFVIEYPNLLMARTTAATAVYAYNYHPTQAWNNGTFSIAAVTWNASGFAVGQTHTAGSQLIPSFGIRPDDAKNARHSHIFYFRGSTNLDLFDLAGSIIGAWTNAIVYDGSGPNVTTGTCSEYAPFGNEGRFAYLNVYVASQVSQIWRFDVRNRVLSPFTPTDIIQTGTAAVGARLATYSAVDGSDTYDVVLLMSHLAATAQELVVTV